MNAWIKASHLTLDVPVYLQRERRASGWGSVFAGAAFDPPQRRLSRLLDDVSFEVGEGDRLAILGRNGAGKSTLLRVLNRVYQPTSGSLEVQGSCQALLNMSLGFNGEATVRENILLRGIAMGLKASFLRGQIDSILEFAGLGHKAAHRLRTLSSGQKMRLGFAISTSVQHDIILMDEWVGAGDSDFMAKARERMHSRVGGSKIVVLASHSVGLLRDICNKGVVLEGGRLVYAGDVTSALKYYHDMMGRLRAGLEHVGPEHALGSAETTQVYGAVDRIEELGPGRFRLRGWMVDTRGAAPAGLAMEVSGQRHPALQFDRVPRPDVQAHFGLASDACGFEALVEVPGAGALHALGPDVRVLGGEANETADATLRLGPSVMAAVATSS